MLPSNQRQVIEQVKFTYSQFGKASENKMDWRARKKTDSCYYKSKPKTRGFSQ